MTHHQHVALLLTDWVIAQRYIIGNTSSDITGDRDRLDQVARDRAATLGLEGWEPPHD